MPEPTYRFRPSLRSPETSYRLAADALEWSGGRAEGRLPYTEIRQIRCYDSPGAWFPQGGVIPGFARCVVRRRHGPPQVLSSNHFVRLGVFENRSASFQPFIAVLIERTAAADPGCVLLTGMPLALWLLWLTVFLLTALVTAFAGAMLIAAVSLGALENLADIAAAALALLTGAVAVRSLWRTLACGRTRRLHGALAGTTR